GMIRVHPGRLAVVEPARPFWKSGARRACDTLPAAITWAERKPSTSGKPPLPPALRCSGPEAPGPVERPLGRPQRPRGPAAGSLGDGRAAHAPRTWVAGVDDRHLPPAGG